MSLIDDDRIDDQATILLIRANRYVKHGEAYNISNYCRSLLTNANHVSIGFLLKALVETITKLKSTKGEYKKYSEDLLACLKVLIGSKSTETVVRCLELYELIHETPSNESNNEADMLDEVFENFKENKIVFKKLVDLSKKNMLSLALEQKIKLLDGAALKLNLEGPQIKSYLEDPTEEKC